MARRTRKPTPLEVAREVARDAQAQASSLRAKLSERDSTIEHLAEQLKKMPNVDVEQANRLRDAALLAEKQRDEAREETRRVNARVFDADALRAGRDALMDERARASKRLLSVLGQVGDSTTIESLADRAATLIDGLRQRAAEMGALKRALAEIRWLAGQLHTIAYEDRYGSVAGLGALVPSRNRQRLLLGFVTERCLPFSLSACADNFARSLQEIGTVTAIDLRYLWDEFGGVPDHLKPRAEETLRLLSALYTSRQAPDGFELRQATPSEVPPI